MKQNSVVPAMSRRGFVAGAASVGAGVAASVVASGAMVGVAHAASPSGLDAVQPFSAGPAGLIGISGRITNALGAPQSGAYVEIMHHRVREWRPGTDFRTVEVESWEAPEWFGVWSDEDGVFGLHTWWPQVGQGSRAVQRAKLTVKVETTAGNRLVRTVWLDGENAAIGRPEGEAESVAFLTPVAWDRGGTGAAFVANFSVG